MKDARTFLISDTVSYNQQGLLRLCKISCQSWHLGKLWECQAAIIPLYVLARKHSDEFFKMFLKMCPHSAIGLSYCLSSLFLPLSEADTGCVTAIREWRNQFSYGLCRHTGLASERGGGGRNSISTYTFSSHQSLTQSTHSSSCFLLNNWTRSTAWGNESWMFLAIPNSSRFVKFQSRRVWNTEMTQ